MPVLLMTGVDFLTFLLLSFVVGRVTRFVCMDALWEEWRERLIDKFEMKTRRKALPNAKYEDVPKSRGSLFLGSKISELLTCPWCVSIYISAGALILSRQLEIHFGWGLESIPLPVWQWLGMSLVAVMCIEWTDGEKQVAVRQNPERGH